jgi:hypothetical protein
VPTCAHGWVWDDHGDAGDGCHRPAPPTDLEAEALQAALDENDAARLRGGDAVHPLTTRELDDLKRHLDHARMILDDIEPRYYRRAWRPEV